MKIFFVISALLVAAYAAPTADETKKTLDGVVNKLKNKINDPWNIPYEMSGTKITFQLSGLKSLKQKGDSTYDESTKKYTSTLEISDVALSTNVQGQSIKCTLKTITNNLDGTIDTNGDVPKFDLTSTKIKIQIDDKSSNCLRNNEENKEFTNILLQEIAVINADVDGEITDNISPTLANLLNEALVSSAFVTTPVTILTLAIALFAILV